MRVIVAGRLSRKVNDRDQTGFDSQEAESVRWARDHGHEVIAVVADFKTGRSGLEARKNLRPWVTDTDKLAEYDGIVALKVDRLTRGNREETAQLEKWARDHGKSLLITGSDVHFPSEGNDGVMWDMMLRFAHQEWLNISERYTRMQRTLKLKGSLTGRPNYGYQIVQAINDAGETIKTQAPVEPMASLVREMKDRYLAGEVIDAIVADFTARGIPAPGKSTVEGQTAKWSAKTIAGYLRSIAYAGIRVNATGANHEGYVPLWTVEEHNALVARLDSRAHRKGISPSNTAMLTSVIIDQAGHNLYRTNSWNGPAYYCRKGCGVSVPVSEADGIVNEAMIDMYGELPHQIKRIVPGTDNTDTIDRLRIQRRELDDMADDYEEIHASLTREIKQLAKHDEENPSPSRVAWIDSGKTIAEHWCALTDAAKRDWLIEHGYRITASRDGKTWVLSIDAGFTAGVDMERQLGSLGFDVKA